MGSEPLSKYNAENQHFFSVDKVDSKLWRDFPRAGFECVLGAETHQRFGSVVAIFDTWSPPLAGMAMPPDMADRDAFSERVNWEVGFSDFIADGAWDDVSDVLRTIYEDAARSAIISCRRFMLPLLIDPNRDRTRSSWNPQGARN